MKIYHSLFPPQYGYKHIHPKTLDNLDNWLEINSDINLQREIHCEEEAREFILKHFDTELVSYFDSQNDGRFKSDIWRLCVLYIYGGIYADIDQKLLKPISSFCDTDKHSFCGVSNMERFNVSNGFIYADKKNKIIEENIKIIYKKYDIAIKNRHLLYDVSFIGGCFIMGEAISKINKDKLMPLGSQRIAEESCMFLHEKGDVYLKNLNKQAFWNSFGVYSQDNIRIMDSRYDTYHIDKYKTNEFINI
jgi:mannosyltransferase OCH1-like enzyme